MNMLKEWLLFISIGFSVVLMILFRRQGTKYQQVLFEKKSADVRRTIRSLKKKSETLKDAHAKSKDKYEKMYDRYNALYTSLDIGRTRRDASGDK